MRNTTSTARAKTRVHDTEPAELVPGRDRVQEQVFLIGRPPIGEFIGMVTTQTIGGDKADIGRLMDEWRLANDHVRSLELEEAGFADAVPVVDLPKELQAVSNEIQSTTVFQRSYRMVPATIGMVELDRLVVYQKHIGLAHVRRIQEGLGPKPTDSAILRVCLPFGEARPQVNGRRVGPDAYMFTSPSNDLRLLESVLLRADQLVNYTPPGHVTNVVALVVGYSPNCLSVLQADGRLVLYNGSHRAYALRDLGITHVPAVVQRVSRPEELELLGVEPLIERRDEYLRAARPPVLKDYFDERLRKIQLVPKRYQQVTIQFGAGNGWLDIPAA